MTRIRFELHTAPRWSGHVRALVVALPFVLALTCLPASASAKRVPLEPTATRVNAQCSGGRGTVSLTVSHPDADGASHVRVIARHLVEGSSWRIAVGYRSRCSVAPPRAERGRSRRTWSWSGTAACMPRPIA